MSRHQHTTSALDLTPPPVTDPVEERKAKARAYATRYYHANKDYVKRQREGSEQKAKTKAYHREYYAANKDRLKTKAKIDPEANRARAKAWREANPEKCKARKRAYRQGHKAELAGANKAYRAANQEKERARDAARRVKPERREQKCRLAKAQAQKPERKAYERTREATLVRRHRSAKLTAEQLSELLAASNGRCPLCQVEFSPGNMTRACVDHCHKTGKVRGMICGRCNWMLGHALDNPNTLRAGARYLESHRDA